MAAVVPSGASSTDDRAPATQAEASTRRRWDVFVSYAHADGARVRDFDRVLRGLLPGRFGRGTIPTFLDEAALTAGDDLERRLCEAMEASERLVVILTSASARSEWVDREVTYWCDNLGRVRQMLLVRADHSIDLGWDQTASGFRSASSLPPAVVRAVKVEPLYIDAPDAEGAAWRQAAVKVAADVKGVTPDEVDGLDAHLRRRSLRRAQFVMALLAILTVAAVVAGTVAARANARTGDALDDAEQAKVEAEAEAARAIAQQAVAIAEDDPALALALAAEARHSDDSAETVDAFHTAYRAYIGNPVQRRHGLVGHSGRVVDAAFTPDGSTIVTASEDRTARAWDTVTGAEQREFAHEDPLTDLAVSHDGKVLATMGHDVIRVWELATGHLVRTFPTPWLAISVALDRTGGRLAASAGHGLVFVWDVATGAEVDVTDFAGEVDDDMSFTPEGAVVTATNEGLVRFAPGSEPVTVTAADPTAAGDAFDVALDPTGTTALVGRAGYTEVWDLGTGRIAGDLSDQLGDTALSVAVDGMTAAFLDREGRTSLASFGDRHGRTVVESTGVDWVVVGGGGRWMAAADSTGTVDLYDLDADVNLGLEMPIDRSSGPGPAMNIDVADDGTAVAYMKPDGKVSIVHTPSGDHRADAGPAGAEVFNVELSHDADLVGMVNGDGAVVVFEVDTGDEAFRAPAAPDGPATGLGFDREDRRIAVANDRVATVWDIARGLPLVALDGHRDRVTDVAFSPDGDQIATGSADGTAALWDADDGRQVMSVDGGMREVTHVSFTPDGNHLVTGSSDGTARLWQAPSGTETRRFTGPVAAVVDTAFSNEGTRLTTLRSDGVATLWDIDSADQVTVLSNTLDRGVLDPYFGEGRLALAGDGAFMAFQRDDTVVTTPLHPTAAEACAAAAPYVTPTELRTALGGPPQVCVVDE